MKLSIKLFVVDDHQIFIDGIKALLHDIENIEIIGEANNGRQALERLKEINADVVLMDIGMADLNGIETTKIILEKLPTVKIIALTMYDDQSKVAKMLRAGVKGYILKDTAKNELTQAIQTVAAGGVYYSDKVIINTMQNISNETENLLSKLTNREIEIIKLIVKSLTNKEIAEKLSISELTVNTHRKNAMRKLMIKNTAGLVKFALEYSL